MKHPALLFTLTFVVLSTPAIAGVADSPLPELVPGEKTLHLYTVPGVARTFSVGTYFSCTSLERSATIQVGVELFLSVGGPAANDAALTSLPLAPGATVMFGTDPAVEFTPNSIIGFAGRGSARILSTSKRLTCTAFLADFLNSPPASMTYLTIIAKTKQKAAN